MTEYHNQLMEILTKGKNQFIKYGLVHTIFDRVMKGYAPFHVNENKVKGIFSEEDLRFFNEYIPALFGLQENPAELTDSQRKELSDMFDDVERIYRDISKK